MGASASVPRITDPQTLAEHEFDYIIVGSGPAGCVLANRLSEDPSNRVLLVEAGGDNETELFSKIPGGWPRLLHTAADWDYRTVEQLELGGRKLYWPRGRLLGGSSSINAMMYQNAPPSDIDEWERKGATGWNWETMAPYFRMSEKFTPSTHHVGTTHEHRGDSGLWNTGYHAAHPISENFIHACAKSGIPVIQEFNTPKGPNGVSHMMSFIDQKGERSSAATAYLSSSVRQRTNLTILTHTRCTKLTVANSLAGKLICTGAEFATSADGPRTRLSAQREVILCSGAIGTPQILMCSGIGPEDDLKRAGIPVTLVNEHVGRNLIDHLTTWCNFHAKDSYDYIVRPIYSLPALLQHRLFGTGALATNKADVATFIRLDQTQPLWDTKLNRLGSTVPDTTSGPSAPDIEIIGSPISFFRHADATLRPPAGSKSFAMGPTLLRPLSAGHLVVKSGDAFEDPIIEANYFDNKEDLHQLMRAARVTLHIAHTSPMADHLEFDYSKGNQDIDNIYWLADQDPDSLTDEKLEQWVRRHAETLYHPVSTARMASSPDDGVVDPNLKVFGISSLRVADASVFPTQIAAHTTATVIALGERAADLILKGK